MSDTTFLTRPAVTPTEALLWPAITRRRAVELGPRPRAGHDEAILVRLRAGDVAATSELIERFHPTCRKLARALAHDECQERALTEEMQVVILRRLRRSRGVSSLDRIAGRIATEVGIERALGPLAAPGLNAVELEPEERQFLATEASDQDGDAAAQSRVARRLFRRILNCLPPEQRLVLSLVELENWTLHEVCQHAGWYQVTAWLRLVMAGWKFNRLLRRMAAPLA